MSAELELAEEMVELTPEVDAELFAGDDPDSPEFGRRLERITDRMFERYFHPDFELRSMLVAFGGGRPYRGREGLMRWATDVATGFSSFVRRGLEVTEIAPGAILIGLRAEAVGRLSGAPIEFDTWSACRFDDGRLRSFETFDTRDQALNMLTGE
ncbi:MAG: hypothetical protein ACJ75R_07530 [Solirubrobacterales bacterium]|jgi:hypothetical protein